MDTSHTSTEEKNRWEDFRDTVRGGVRELRNIGDELARQGRLRMDVYQTERRLNRAYEQLGKSIHMLLADNQSVNADDAIVSELRVRIVYYEAELKRLNDELQKCSGGQN